jgi:hypothetical protein
MASAGATGEKGLASARGATGEVGPSYGCVAAGEAELREGGQYARVELENTVLRPASPSSVAARCSFILASPGAAGWTRSRQRHTAGWTRSQRRCATGWVCSRWRGPGEAAAWCRRRAPQGDKRCARRALPRGDPGGAAVRSPGGGELPTHGGVLRRSRCFFYFSDFSP